MALYSTIFQSSWVRTCINSHKTKLDKMQRLIQKLWQRMIRGSKTNLEHCHHGPEQRVKVFSVISGIFILGYVHKFAAKQLHTHDTAKSQQIEVRVSRAACGSLSDVISRHLSRKSLCLMFLRVCTCPKMKT